MEFVQSFFRNSSSGTKNAVYLSTAAALGLAALYVFSAKPQSSSSKLAPALTEEETQEILSTIVSRVKLTVTRLMQYAEGIKQQIAMQGQEIDDKQLYKSVVLPHLETAIRDIQAATLEEKGVDDDEFEEAVNTYLTAGDKDITALANSLKKIYVNFGGEVEEEAVEEKGAVEKRKREMTVDELVQFLADLSERVLERSDEYAGNFVAQYGTPSDIASLQAFQMGLMQLTEILENELLAKHNLTTEDFQQLVAKHQNHRRVQEIFYLMKVMNNRLMQQHGIPVPDEAM